MIILYWFGAFYVSVIFNLLLQIAISDMSKEAKREMFKLLWIWPYVGWMMYKDWKNE